MKFATGVFVLLLTFALPALADPPVLQDPSSGVSYSDVDGSGTLSAGDRIVADTPAIRAGTSGNSQFSDLDGNGVHDNGEPSIGPMVDQDYPGSGKPLQRRYYYPEDFATGSTTGGIQEAIDAAAGSQWAGGKVVLANRKYFITGSTPITISGSGTEITLEGSGPGATIIACQANMNCTAPAVLDIEASNATVRDLSVVNTNTTSGDTGIRIENASDGLLQNLMVDGDGSLAAGSRAGTGIHVVGGAYRWDVDHVRARFWADAALLDSTSATGSGSNHTQFVAFRASNNDTGIRSTLTSSGYATTTNILVIGGSFESNYGCAIQATEGNETAEKATVQASNAWFEGNGKHICSNGAEIRTRGNVFNNTTSGTYIQVTGGDGQVGSIADQWRQDGGKIDISAQTSPPEPSILQPVGFGPVIVRP